MRDILQAVLVAIALMVGIVAGPLLLRAHVAHLQSVQSNQIK